MVDSIALLAEFFGTFLLTLAVLASGGSAIAIGGTLAIIVALVGKVSGAHVNPAVSAAMYAKGTLDEKELTAYVVSQIAGAVASFFAFKKFA